MDAEKNKPQDYEVGDQGSHPKSRKPARLGNRILLGFKFVLLVKW